MSSGGPATRPPTPSFAGSTWRRSPSRPGLPERDRRRATPRLVDPSLAAAGLPPLGELARSDVSRFFRAAELDADFPAAADRLARRDAGRRSASTSRAGATSTSTPSRGRPSPRERSARRCGCPDEVYLVIAPVGGRDDYGALFHEAGHTEHYANVDPALPFEFRHLGDNSVTESFAFLLEHLTEDPALAAGAPRRRRRRGDGRPGPGRPAGAAAPLRGQARLRARAARRRPDLATDAGALRGAARLGALGSRGRRRPGSSTSTRASTSPATCGPGRSRPTGGPRFASASASAGSRPPEAGEWLRGLWAHGQRLDADELLAEALGSELDFRVMARELRGRRARPDAPLAGRR